jgi:hypothetical protein
MVEYGQGVSEGAGTVAGSGGGLGGSGGGDWGAGILGAASDAVDQVAGLPPAQLLLLAIVVLVGLMLLKRAL